MATMQVSVRATNQQSFTVVTQPSETIGQLKEKIHTDHGHSPETQKLIYSGRILNDATTIESCAIKESEFLILMLSKARPAYSASTSAAASSSPAASSSYVASRPAAASSAFSSSNLFKSASALARPPGTASAFSSSLLAGASTPAARPAAVSSALASLPAPTTQVASTSGGSSGGSTENSFLLGPGVQEAIAKIEAMGFPREQVEKAMRASFNNPDRAVEYLTNGIPPHLEREAAGSSALTATSQQSVASGSSGSGLSSFAQSLGGASEADIEGLARDPATLRQMKEHLKANPAMMQHLVEKLSADNPELGNVLRDNPDMFFQMLESAQGRPSEAGSTTIQVTVEEKLALDRLAGLGFSRQQAIKAFIAADRNEEHAANLLFDNIFGEGEPDDDNDRNDDAQPATGISASTSATQQPAEKEQEASSSTAPPATEADRTALSNLFQREQQSGGANGTTTETPGRNSMTARQMREHLMSNPEMMEMFIQSLSEDHPEMANMLRNDPEMFFQRMEMAEGKGLCVEVTPDEKESIDRLESLGFTRSQAVQAFFAGDKNEEVAANLLFDGAFKE